MPPANTPKPTPTPFSEHEKCTLHDGTWPLRELVARLRSEPQRPAPVPIARSEFPKPDPVPRSARPVPSRRPEAAAAAGVALRQVPAPVPRTARNVRPAPRSPAAAQVSTPPGPRKKRKRSAEQRLVLDPGAADAKRRAGDGVDAERATRMRAKALDLVRRKRLADALKVMHQAITLDRNDGHSMALCAWLIFQDTPEHASHSLELLERAERTAPRCARVHYYRGLVLGGLGRHDDAALCFERALDLDPEDLQSARELRLHVQRSKGVRKQGWLKKG